MNFIDCCMFPLSSSNKILQNVVLVQLYKLVCVAFLFAHVLTDGDQDIVQVVHGQLTLISMLQNNRKHLELTALLLK